MLIAEFTMDHPVLREPLDSVPDIEAVWEQTYEQPDGPTQMIVWIEGDDFEAVDAALADDPGVANPSVLVDVGARRLYRVDFTDLGRETNLLPKVVEVGGVLQQAVGTNDGWRCRVRVPNRAAFEQVYRFCLDHGIDFTFHRLYEQTSWPGEAGPTLTATQRETLIEALDSGYLAIPRECSLAELGDRLDISESAASERFRRAVRKLVERTIYP